MGQVTGCEVGGVAKSGLTHRVGLRGGCETLHVKHGGPWKRGGCEGGWQHPAILAQASPRHLTLTSPQHNPCMSVTRSHIAHAGLGSTVLTRY